MTDPDITNKISMIKDSVDLINKLMSELHEKNVEIRISYVDANKDRNVVPGIKLWRATEHVDYLEGTDGQ
jgi:hypothetical protein